jgi:hypothetical protein
LKTRSEPRSSGQVGYKNKQCLRHVYGNEQPCFAYYSLLCEVFFIFTGISETAPRFFVEQRSTKECTCQPPLKSGNDFTYIYSLLLTHARTQQPILSLHAMSFYMLHNLYCVSFIFLRIYPISKAMYKLSSTKEQILVIMPPNH